MGERHGWLFEPTFNRSVKLRQADHRISDNAGALLLREIDHRLALTADLAAELTDPRRPDRIRYQQVELLRQHLYSLALGHVHQDDHDILAHDPAVRLAVWNRPGKAVLDERLASQPSDWRLVDRLASRPHRRALRNALADSVRRHQQAAGPGRKVLRGTIDIDPLPVEVHGQQQGAAWHGHYHAKIYYPLAASFCAEGNYDSNRLGEGFLHAVLRAGDCGGASGAVRFVHETIGKSRELAMHIDARIDAGLVDGRTLDAFDDEGVRVVGRIKNNARLDRLAEPYLSRRPGRPTKDGDELAIELGHYQAESWSRPYRLVLVIIDLPDPKTGLRKLFPHHFFLVTNWPAERMGAWALLEHYRKRGTFEDRLGEFNACVGNGLSAATFEANETALLLKLLAFNLAGIVRGELEDASGNGGAAAGCRRRALSIGRGAFAGGRPAGLGAGGWAAVMNSQCLGRLAKTKRYVLRPPNSVCRTPCCGPRIVRNSVSRAGRSRRVVSDPAIGDRLFREADSGGRREVIQEIPAERTTRVKAIFILSDSFRQDHLGGYGNRTIHTPNLDRLAGRSCVFTDSYAGSFPTGPNRRDIYLSKGHAPGHAFNPWTNFTAEETPFQDLLRRTGVHAMMITDVANGVQWGGNRFKGFDAYCVHRGQEGDGWWSDASLPMELPCPGELIRYRPEHYQKVRVNRSHRRYEEDCFAPGTFRTACHWLERNWRRDNFLLWVETFDPHEPWDPPQWHIRRYDPDYAGRIIEAPPYGYYRKMGITEREVRHIQARYCGECTMVDYAVGGLLATLERLDLLDEVAIVFTSDHGIYAGYPGDAGLVGKPWFLSEGKAWLMGGDPTVTHVTWLPLRTGTTRIPLMIKLPGQRRGRRIGRIAQPWDLAPTLLELFGVRCPEDYIGQSLTPLLAGKSMPPRPLAFNGYLHRGGHLKQAMNRRWIYSIWPGVDQAASLIDLREDPAQRRNVAGTHPEVCRRLHAALRRFDPEGMKDAASSE